MRKLTTESLQRQCSMASIEGFSQENSGPRNDISKMNSISVIMKK